MRGKYSHQILDEEIMNEISSWDKISNESSDEEIMNVIQYSPLFNYYDFYWTPGINAELNSLGEGEGIYVSSTNEYIYSDEELASASNIHFNNGALQTSHRGVESEISESWEILISPDMKVIVILINGEHNEGSRCKYCVNKFTIAYPYGWAYGGNPWKIMHDMYFDEIIKPPGGNPDYDTWEETVTLISHDFLNTSK